MIWHSTNYFNQALVTGTSVSEKTYHDRTAYVVQAVILGVAHTLGESETKEDAQKWLDAWKSEGKKSAEAAEAAKAGKQ